MFMTNMEATVGQLTSTGLALRALPPRPAGPDANGYTVDAVAIGAERS
jgi:hypothetical protein